MIVYYYSPNLQITSIGVMPHAWEIFSMTPFSSRNTTKRIASLVTAINVLVASGFSIAGLVSPKSILPADYAPTEASFIFAMYAGDLQTFGNSLASIGYIGRCHTIAGCGGRVVPA